MKKHCNKCGCDKALSEFGKDVTRSDGLSWWCRKCVRQNVKRYEGTVAGQRSRQRYVNANRERYAIRNHEYHRAHADRINELKRKRHRAYSVDPTYRIVKSLRARIWQALQLNNQSDATQQLLGCTIAHLKLHLESQFKPGMTWDNYGEWHIDHIRPCASFDLSKPAQQRKCFHYTNLQPLWAKENILKSNKILC